MPPILLLKTKSSPTDPYDTLLSSAGFSPIFIPVLQHECINGDLVREYILSGAVLPPNTAKDGRDGDEEKKVFGGIIITSQRAVEALGSILEELKVSHADLIDSLLRDTLIYVVGPATASSLSNLGFSSQNILGASSGNGLLLSDFIIEHYPTTLPQDVSRDLLFLTGETHSTILPSRVPEKLKQFNDLNIKVEEVVVYKTAVMSSFESDFRKVLSSLPEKEEIWTVIFSPTGTSSAISVIQEHEPPSPSSEHKNSHTITTPPNGKRNESRFKICAIGPTTKDYMYQKFHRAPDAMAKEPSPEGVLEAVRNPSRVAAELVS